MSFPSLHEGFGLPVLEAMRLGTPVLTSRTSSLPEVAGPAGLLVDPYDVEAIAGALRALDADEALRDRLAAMGPSQADRFAPARYAERLDAMYAANVTLLVLGPLSIIGLVVWVVLASKQRSCMYP